MSILVPKSSSSTTRLRVAIPASLAAEIETIRRQAEAHGLTIDVSAICADALARAVKQARAELGRLHSSQSGHDAA